MKTTDKMREAIRLLELSAQPFDKACMLLREAIVGDEHFQPAAEGWEDADTPIAWTGNGCGVITHKAKLSMLADRHLGGEFEIGARTAERHDIPLVASTRDALFWKSAFEEEHEANSRLCAELNAINGPTFMGEPVLSKSQHCSKCGLGKSEWAACDAPDCGELVAAPTPPQEHKPLQPAGPEDQAVYQAIADNYAQERPEAVEPVAWRWKQSDDFPDWVVSDDKEKTKAALSFGLNVQSLYTISPTATQALRMAADVCDAMIQQSPRNQYREAAAWIKQRILAIIPPTESDQRKLGFAEGVKAAAIWLRGTPQSEGGMPLLSTDFMAVNIEALTPPTDMVTMTREGEPLSYTGRQPDNIVAWRIGEACSKAAADPKCGDYIDRGLILMKELQAKGYGICAIVAQHMPEVGK